MSLEVFPNLKVLGCAIYEGYEVVREHPKGGYEDCEGSGGEVTWFART